jgi:phosphatidylglycerophosphate synthase
MMTIVWCAGIVGFSYLAIGNRRWLWAVSAMILGQYLTDHFDGKIGKYRNTGLERWGYYMDHLLDYFFLASVILGYAFILPEKSRYQLLIMIVLFGAYDMSTFLAFAASNELKISYLKFGPTEFRLALIVINGLVAEYGIRHMVGGLKFVNAGAFVGLCLMVYQTQKKIRAIDFAQKRARRALVPAAKCEVHPSGNVTVQPQPSLYELGSR